MQRRSFLAGALLAGPALALEGRPTIPQGLVASGDVRADNLKPNRPPGPDTQFFGQVDVEGPRCRVSLHNQSGKELFRQELVARSSRPRHAAAR